MRQENKNKTDLKYLTLKLTNRCNLNCIMCGQVYSGQRAENDDLSFELIKRSLVDINTIEHVYLFGGEPLLYNNFIPLLEMLKDRKLPTLITTNGVILDQYTNEIIKNEVRNIEISIDSHKADVYEKVRGKGLYNKVLGNLEILINEKKRQNSKYPFININCVILPNNCKDLLEYYNFFEINYPEINKINFEFPMITTSEIGEKNEFVFKNEFGSNAESWKWFYNKLPMFTDHEIKLIYDQIEQLRLCSKAGVKGSMEYQGYLDTFTQSYLIPTRICEHPFSTITILPDGEVTFCADFPDYIVGNVKNHPLTEIWNCERAEKVRNYLLKNGNFPICSRCCHRYEILPS